MSTKNLLLLSSSRVKSTGYLEHAKTLIKQHLVSAEQKNQQTINEVLFIPYAGVTVSYDDYTAMVNSALQDLAITVKGIHQYKDAKTAIMQAQAIMVGGGNTFHLLQQLYQHDLISSIQNKVAQGTPYIGWSAGSNIAGASIKTTNDMPIVEPDSFTALNLVNFQLNPHYTDHNPPGHNGETREQRLAEFMVVDPQTAIVAIIEGSALQLKDDRLSLLITEHIDDVGYLFKAGEKTQLSSKDDLSFLL
ncbi:MAG: dipeptidase PepE [Alteromonadaceae bacterium]|nr:dipeptidase PepE [Alteromonadaceae bacterium]